MITYILVFLIALHNTIVYLCKLRIKKLLVVLFYVIVLLLAFLGILEISLDIGDP